MSTDSKDGLFSNEESQLYDDDSGRGIMSGTLLKKGPWTAAEDAILIDYVNKHGEGNWNAVQKHAGLFRCGKSCRLRWANHLRPNLKKGPFTAEEERLIIELHAKMGNKWARMAAHLPGRTDNEIKNYWNTRIKRRQRAGLSLYPQEACLQALLESTSDGPLRMNDQGSKYSNTNSYDAHDVILHSMPGSHDAFPYFSEHAGESSDNMFFKPIGSSRQSNFASSQQPKRYCGPRSRECGSEVIFKNELYSLEPVQDDPQVKPAGFIFPYDRDPGDHNWSLGVIQDSHSFVHCNFSTPKLACEAVKSELPSFQYPDTDSSNWDTSYSASPLLDPFESNTQYETPAEIVHSESSSPRNSGLLDALLYEARAISGVKNQSSKKSSNSSAVTPINFADEIGLKICETEVQNKSEPISPLDSATSIYSRGVFTPPCGTQKDSHPFLETVSESIIKSEPIDNVNNPFEDIIPARFESLDPGMSSYTYWLEQESTSTMKQNSLEDAVAEALVSRSELSTDCRYLGSSKPGQGWGVGSYVWNKMPMVHQVSKLP